MLDGTWESTEPSTAPSLEQFWKTWQPIFETRSTKDNRRPTCVGQVKWEIVAPVTPTELQQVLSEGFRCGDGVAQHVLSLQSIIDEAKRKLKPLSLAFLEVRKAFDSVSHDTIESAMRRLGCPDPFLAYIRELYARSSTVIEHNGERSVPIFTRGGIKQGDPLSQFMFNAVIDWAFSSLDDHPGFSFCNIRVNNLGFANDVALLSDMRAGLRSQLGKFESHLSKGGLTISAGTEGKSSSLSLTDD